MRILAVDTATESCSVAIVEKGSLLAELTNVTRQTHSRHLMEMIAMAIRLAGLRVSDLDGFAVTGGPGSFTGLRIGISTVKGLAVASNKPLVGVSSLEALACQFPGSTALICPFLDARRGEVYFARYRWRSGVLKKEVEERVLTPAQAVAGIEEPCLFVGNGTSLYRDMLKEMVGRHASFALPNQNVIRASTVAHLSMDRFEKKDTDDAAAFVPHYIRKSDAELKLGQKRQCQ